MDPRKYGDFLISANVANAGSKIWMCICTYAFRFASITNGLIYHKNQSIHNLLFRRVMESKFVSQYMTWFISSTSFTYISPAVVVLSQLAGITKFLCVCEYQKMKIVNITPAKSLSLSKLSSWLIWLYLKTVTVSPWTIQRKQCGKTNSGGILLWSGLSYETQTESHVWMHSELPHSPFPSRSFSRRPLSCRSLYAGVQLSRSSQELRHVCFLLMGHLT